MAPPHAHCIEAVGTAKDDECEKEAVFKVGDDLVGVSNTTCRKHVSVTDLTGYEVFNFILTNPPPNSTGNREKNATVSLKTGCPDR